MLISGETGTGKELAARAIHENSRRARRPFVAINCAALTESLLESELFGHERGAFTGAVAQKKGKLEVADGGTVFLDEIGELPPGAPVEAPARAPGSRVRARRRHAHHQGRRPGDRRDQPRPRGGGRRGPFRQDLYYRLNVVSLTMPPLRDRREDIPVLAAHFAAKYGARAARCRCRRGAARRSRRTTGRATSASWRTRSSAPSCSAASDRILADDLPESLVEMAAATGAG